MKARLLALVGLLSACVPTLARPEQSTRGTAAAAGEYPGELPDPRSIQENFQWQQEITSAFGKRTVSGVVAVEKEGPRLTAVGLTPFGSRAFVLVQEGQKLTFTKFVDVELGVSPRVMLVDIHRAFLMGAGTQSRPDGSHVYRRAGEIVRETWRGGRLLERTFERPGGPKGVIRIRYEGGMQGITPPATVVLENGWYGYTLTIRTVAASRI